MKAHTVEEVVDMIWEPMDMVPSPQKFVINVSRLNFDMRGMATMNTNMGISLHIVTSVVINVACLTPFNTRATKSHTNMEPAMTETTLLPFPKTGKKYPSAPKSSVIYDTLQMRALIQ